MDQSRSYGGVPSLTSPQTATSSTPLQFTFVNQAEDLQAVASKRLKNEKQRHQIRSHVMRGVRQHELAQGKKRPTGREPHSIYSRNVRRRTPIPKNEDTFSPGHGTLAITSPANGCVLYMSPNTNPNVDPFNSLPYGEVPAATINSLIHYCFTIMLPMTFIVENEEIHEVLSRRAVFLQIQIDRPMAFCSFMAMTAIHRAILFGHYRRDLAYPSTNCDDSIDDTYFQDVRRAARNLIDARIEAGEVDDVEFVEACCGLTATAINAGNHDEAATYMRHVQNDFRFKPIPDVVASWVPITDNKYALTTLSKPLIRLPLPVGLFPEELVRRLTPRSGSPLLRLATGFAQNLGLSDQIRALLPTANMLCVMYEYMVTARHALLNQEQHVFRNVAYKLENALLSYPYDIYPHIDERPETLIMPPLEMIIRLAVLGLLASIAMHVLPASGVGRALTRHQKKAVLTWLREASEYPNVADMKVVAWALFVFIRNAEDQAEAIQFERLLTSCLKRLWLLSWEEVEATLYQYLYVPRAHRPVFMKTWDEIKPKVTDRSIGF